MSLPKRTANENHTLIEYEIFVVRLTSKFLLCLLFDDNLNKKNHFNLKKIMDFYGKSHGLFDA